MRPAFVVTTLLACGPAPAPAPSCPPALVPVTVAVDGGVEAVAPGSTLEIIAGPQGGFHVLVGAEVSGAERRGRLEWELSDDGGVLASRSLEVSELVVEDAGCGWLRRRDLLIFDRNEDAQRSRGRHARLDARFGSLAAERVVELR